jgi:hypothetical protein
MVVINDTSGGKDKAKAKTMIHLSVQVSLMTIEQHVLDTNAGKRLS